MDSETGKVFESEERKNSTGQKQLFEDSKTTEKTLCNENLTNFEKNWIWPDPIIEFPEWF